MSNGNVPSRAKRVAGVIGTSAAVAALGLTAAGSAQASPYATGWQCISPFANFTNNTFPSDPPAPNGIIDSLALSVSRPGGDPIVATAGQRLPLHDVQLGLELKDPRIIEQLYTRTGGVTLNYSGRPLGQPTGTTTNRSMTRVEITPALAAAISATTTNPGGGTAPAAGETWWAFTVNNQTAANAADLNTGWYSDGTPNSSGAFTRTFYTEAVSGSAPPRDNAGSYIAASASVGHKYVTHTGNNHFPINAWVTIEASNTVEKVQTVQAKGYWTINVEDTSPGSLTNPAGFADGGHTVTAPPVSLDLPRSNWTPTGAGPVEFRVAAPGQSGPAVIESKGYDRAGYNRPVVTRPFGSVFVRADTEAYGASNDCVPGTIGIADSTIAASFWGNARPNADASNPDTSIGSVSNPGFVLNNQGTAWNAVKGAAGRYSFAVAAQPAFAAAPLAAVTPPPPAPYTAKALKVTSGSLKKSKSNTVSLKVSNPNAKSAKYKVTVKTVSKYALTKKGKKAVRSAVAGKTVTVGAGKTATTKLKLSKAAKTLLKTRKSLKVKVTIAPTDGKVAKKATKKLTLKR